MSKTVLGALLKSKMDALSDADKANRSKTFEALADAIIQHITTSATIVVTGTATGVTAGAATAPVAGTAVIT